MASCAGIYDAFKRRGQASADLEAAQNEIRMDVPMFFQELVNKCAQAAVAPGNEAYTDELFRIGEAAGEIFEMLDAELGRRGDLSGLVIDMSNWDENGDCYRFRVSNSRTSQDVTLELTREIRGIVGID